MNKKMVMYILGKLLQILGILLLAPLVVSIIYDEPLRYPMSYLITAAFNVLLGYFMTKKEPKKKNLYAKEGFVIVSLSWFLLSLFGAFPFVINGDIPSLVDAFFETTSGFTTTGSTILVNASTLTHSSMFWRSFTHLIGGMGVLVFALAILPKVESQTVHIMKAEVPGPEFGKLVSRLADSARILYYIYIVFTAVVVTLLIVSGMPVFDSFIHAFSAAGTGGFSIHGGSMTPYNNLNIEIILGVAMLLFGVNFNLYFLMLSNHFKDAIRSEELRWYLGIVLGAVLLITVQLRLVSHSFPNALRHSFFSVTSIITTTGFTTQSFNNWPLFSRLILFFLMFVGGMAGSTSGGLKISRVVILFKTAISELKRNTYPNRIVSIHFENKPLDNRMIRSISSYFIVYIVVFLILLIFISFEVDDFSSAFSASAATLNNIGGLGVAGIDTSFHDFTSFNKIIVSIGMIMGRLEIFPVLILFSPSVWRRHA